jgi:hypothetical protein
MKKTKVGCWVLPFHNKSNNTTETVYLTKLSDWGQGYVLLSCLKCSTIYTYDTETELYAKLIITEKLKITHCITCNSLLSKTSSQYPDSFLGNDKKIHHYKKPWILNTPIPPNELFPPDEEIIYEEFYDLYSE